MHKALLCCALASLLLGRLAVADTVLAVGDQWCPYNCALDNPQPGYVVELLQDIFADQQPALEYRVVPWSRAIKMVESGKADLLLAATAKGSPALQMSVPIGVDTTCFFVGRDSTWHFTGMAELQGLRIGVIQDYSYDDGGELDRYIAASRPEEGRVLLSSGQNALQTNFNKLMGGRIDLLLENCNVGRYSLRHLGLLDKVRTAGELPGYRGELNIGVNSADPRARAWLEQLRRGLAAQRSSGALAALLQRYGLSDWAEQSGN